MMRCKWMALIAVIALAMPLSARASGLFGCSNCGPGHGLFGGGFGHGGYGYGDGYGHGNHGCSHAGGNGGFGFFQRPFQAAPWYLYYPYDQHFQMPAPIGAPYFAPQAYANPAFNSYFPPAYGAPAPMPTAPVPAVPGTPIPAVK